MASALSLSLAVVTSESLASAEEETPTIASFNTGVQSTGTGVAGGSTAGVQLDVRMKSWSDLRWENVVRQRTDVGCGAASLATLLTYYFDFPTDELEMVQALYAEAANDHHDPGVVRARGFNLKHIRNVARKGGLVAAAFNVDLEHIELVKVPVITRVTIKGYDHYAVFRGARAGRVYLADPAFGNTSYRLDQFARIWSGVMMGFVRRGERVPTEHLLMVQQDDQRDISWKDLMRIAAQEPSDFRLERGPVGGAISLYDNIRPRIEGLESAFPTIKGGVYVFGEDIVF